MSLVSLITSPGRGLRIFTHGQMRNLRSSNNPMAPSFRASERFWRRERIYYVLIAQQDALEEVEAKEDSLNHPQSNDTGIHYRNESRTGVIYNKAVLGNGFHGRIMLWSRELIYSLTSNLFNAFSRPVPGAALLCPPVPVP